MDAEAQLVRRVQDGDAAALRELHAALGGHVLALALRMTGSREDAEEVLQDTFVDVHDRAARFDPARGSVRAWIYAIARNVCRMKLRARRSRPVKADGVDLASPATPARTHLAGPGGMGAHPTDRLTLEQAFAVLSRDEARLLEASFFAGYSHAEIAENEGVPIGTVKSRIRRAMLKARDALSHGSDDADDDAVSEAGS